MKARIDRLEPRALLAAISWDGGAGTDKWTDALNWSSDTVPTATDDVTISGTSVGAIPNTTVNSLTLESTGGLYWHTGRTLQVATSLHMKPGSRVFTINGKIAGTGTMTIDAGADWSTDPGHGGAGSNYDASIDIPVNNYGTVTMSGGQTLGPDFRNHGTLYLRFGGRVNGKITNEATGTLTSIPDVYRPPLTIELGVYNGVAVPVVNRGSIFPGGAIGTGLTRSESSYPGYRGITVFVDATPVIGGTWNSSNSPLTFASFDTTTGAKSVAFDETFTFTDGTLTLRNVIANVTRLPVDVGLIVNGALSDVTLSDQRTSLAMLRLNAGTLRMSEAGNKVLRVQDTIIEAGATLHIGNNLFIAGNAPGYRQPGVTNVPAPSLVPAFSTNVRGSVAGVPISAALDPAAPGPLAVAYARGEGLIELSGTTFRGEMIDANDFVFVPAVRGDANLDGTVNFADLLRLAQHYGQTTANGYPDGNFNDPATNSGVEFADLLLIAQHYGQTFSVAPAITSASAKKRDAVGSERVSSSVLM